MVANNPSVLCSQFTKTYDGDSGCEIFNDLKSAAGVLFKYNQLADQKQTQNEQCSHTSLLDCGKCPIKLCVSEADHSAWPVQSIFGNQNLSAQ
jgi:hypothetical protein